jgi:sugar phosphate isomerase/epimerase
MDVGHTARTGVDVVEAVQQAGPRLLDMHIKDLKSSKDKSSQVPVGDGALPIPGIFRQLEKMGYTGYVNLEYEVDDLDPMPGMTKSFAYMRGVLAGMNHKG